jgi:hydroxymethylpyrimidine/phosphomethylpyrimidine kinase
MQYRPCLSMRCVIVRRAHFRGHKKQRSSSGGLERQSTRKKDLQVRWQKGAACCPKMKEEGSLRSKGNDVKDLAESSIIARALTVAGYDPSSGAGVTADLEVFRGHSVAGVSAVTALTVQSSTTVRRVEPVSAALLQETLELLAQDTEITGVKIGMLATAELVGVVTKFLTEAGIPRERIVLDPVIRSSSGAELLSASGVERLREELLPVVGWVTPNLLEAGILAGAEGLVGREEVPGVATRIQALGGEGLNVVVTGGHLDPPDDFLLTEAGEEVWFPGVWVEGRGVHGSHGTGCVFSSALLCGLMRGRSGVEAVQGAKEWVVRRLAGNRDYAESDSAG